MRRYYSSRNKPNNLTLENLYQKLKHLYFFFRDKDYFRSRAGITLNFLPDAAIHEAALVLSFQPFPIEKWTLEDITEDRIFDTLEFLYDHVSAPTGDMVWITDDNGWNYQDYISYSVEPGQKEFRDKANAFLIEYKTGFELTREGFVLAKSSNGLQQILDAEIIHYDEANVDSKVRNAIAKWRNRHLSMSEKKEAIRELADVFEWLKKTKNLSSVLDNKDETAIFEIANSFAIRHHDPKQKKKLRSSNMVCMDISFLPCNISRGY